MFFIKHIITSLFVCAYQAFDTGKVQGQLQTEGQSQVTVIRNPLLSW